MIALRIKALAERNKMSAKEDQLCQLQATSPNT